MKKAWIILAVGIVAGCQTNDGGCRSKQSVEANETRALLKQVVWEAGYVHAQTDIVQQLNAIMATNGSLRNLVVKDSEAEYKKVDQNERQTLLLDSR